MLIHTSPYKEERLLKRTFLILILDYSVKKESIPLQHVGSHFSIKNR